MAKRTLPPLSGELNTAAKYEPFTLSDEEWEAMCERVAQASESSNVSAGNKPKFVQIEESDPGARVFNKAFNSLLDEGYSPDGLAQNAKERAEQIGKPIHLQSLTKIH